MAARSPRLTLSTLHRSVYGWPLRQLRIPRAHKTTRGSPDVVVAVIDLGYRHHPDHDGHLWVNPSPGQGDIHGWDCHDDDASLEYNLEDPDSTYHKGHHAFVVGEVIACAPQCPVMVVRVGYGNPDSWARGIDYAVEHGAQILVIPHGFITHGLNSPVPLFYRGTDFSYPIDNPGLRQALDRAYDADRLVVRGTADNRGRRVATHAALANTMALGSSNRRRQAADICCSADYVDAAAPGGERSSPDPQDQVWCTGGDRDYIPFTGGCMASGFAGGVAALVRSRFPDLAVDQVRQVLRNTTGNETWDPKLGWGILDAYRAVRLAQGQLGQDLRIRTRDPAALLPSAKDTPTLQVTVENRGALDVRSALLAVYNGDPRKPATRGNQILVTRQIGHAIRPVRGLHRSVFRVELVEAPGPKAWCQVCTLDVHGSARTHTTAIRISEDAAP